jgi:uncharacterized protein (TIGR01777 family)
MTIVITGGSGFIGSQISKRLLSEGKTVIIIDIIAPSFTHKDLFFIYCDITSGPLPYNILDKTDAVINLAGKSIFGKWTEETKNQIRKSCIDSTRHIVESIIASENKPSCFICASATGFYGDTGEEIFDEQSSMGEGFLAEVVSEWESVARGASGSSVRVVCVRTAPVLGHGGMLKQLTKTSKFGFLLKLRKQDFWMPWIHEQDIVNAYLFALETKTLQGVFNAVSPNQVKHSVFMETLSRVVNRKILGNIPSFFSKKIFGEFFDEITKNQRIAPKRLLDKGFIFLYPELENALKQILKK